MFEKEAEEWLIDNVCKDCTRYEKCKSKEHCTCKECSKEKWQKGAEFGYNKANEWHKVADGDLPKAYQKCYFIYSNYYNKNGKVNFSESSVSVRTGLYAFYYDEEGEETTDPCFYDDIVGDEIDPSEVYAWKEIVLPELKESE